MAQAKRQSREIHEGDRALTELRWTIAEINALDRDVFVARLGFLFEGSAWIATEAWQARPFASRNTLYRALCTVVDRASQEERLALIRAHPDLVGRAALAGTLGQASSGEQAAAGLDPNHLSASDVAAFTTLNHAYQARFGFPFVICARENKKESILAGFTTRLTNTPQREIQIALAEIAKICHYRLCDIVQPDE